jgi:hypothetical protein
MFLYSYRTQPGMPKIYMAPNPNPHCILCIKCLWYQEPHTFGVETIICGSLAVQGPKPTIGYELLQLNNHFNSLLLDQGILHVLILNWTYACFLTMVETWIIQVFCISKFYPLVTRRFYFLD